MRDVSALAALCALGALGACSSDIIGDPGTSYGPRQRAESCGAADYRHLVGQPRSAVQGLPLPRDVRLIGPDTAVTMDHDPGRLNIRYDASGIIREVFCG